MRDKEANCICRTKQSATIFFFQIILTLWNNLLTCYLSMEIPAKNVLNIYIFSIWPNSFPAVVEYFAFLGSSLIFSPIFFRFSRSNRCHYLACSNKSYCTCVLFVRSYYLDQTHRDGRTRNVYLHSKFLLFSSRGISIFNFFVGVASLCPWQSWIVVEL